MSQLIQSPTGTMRKYQADGETLDVLGNGEECPLFGQVTFLRTQRAILVRAALRTEVALSCGRCLGDFGYPLELEIEEEYLPTVDVVTSAPLPLPEDPGAFLIDQHHVIDLAEAVRQYAVMTMPMKPLCREGCAGLCPRCGKNLNHGDCSCPGQVVDTRWQELNKIRK